MQKTRTQKPRGASWGSPWPRWVMASADWLEGDGWLHNSSPEISEIIEAARNCDELRVRNLVAAGDIPLGSVLFHMCMPTGTGYNQLDWDLGLGQSTSVQFLLEVCGFAAGANTRSARGWTPLATAVSGANLRIIELLLSAGADPNRCVVSPYYNRTPLQLINSNDITKFTSACDARTRRLVSHLLLRYGAEILPRATDRGEQVSTSPTPTTLSGRAYLSKVATAGGLRAYEKAHQKSLATTLARVVFPRLPVDAVSHVVAFSFHTGYY